MKSLSLNVIACKFTLKNGPITVGHPFRHCGLDQGDCGSVPAMTEKAAPLPSMASPFVIAKPSFFTNGNPIRPKWQPHSSKTATPFVQNGNPIRQERPLYRQRIQPFAVIAGLTRNLLLKAAMSNNRLLPSRLDSVNQPEEKVC